MNIVGIARRLSRMLSATLVIALVANAPVRAQDPANPPLWIKDSIRSTVLGETRMLRISLPLEYDAREFAAVRYPVLIVLDADEDPYFTANVASVRALGVAGPPMIPRLIIVGVETPDGMSRIHDMTLMIFSSDAGFTLRPAPGSELTLDLDGSSFTIPVVGGSAKLKAALGAR
jgi:hypothetical protein